VNRRTVAGDRDARSGDDDVRLNVVGEEQDHAALRSSDLPRLDTRGSTLTRADAVRSCLHVHSTRSRGRARRRIEAAVTLRPSLQRPVSAGR
jgi:hypothetical protein